jgi:DNA-binding PadR family transcriptional regulator
MGSENDSEDQEELRTEVMRMLAQEPRSGMDLITAFAEREEDSKVIPPLTMYPLLEDLSAEGLVRLSMAEGAGSRQRPYELTPVGWFVLQGGPTEPGFADTDEDEEGGTAPEATRIAVRTDTGPSTGDPSQHPPGSIEEAAQRLWNAVEEIRYHVDDDKLVEEARRRVMVCTRELRRILASAGPPPAPPPPPAGPPRAAAAARCATSGAGSLAKR